MRTKTTTPGGLKSLGGILRAALTVTSAFATLLWVAPATALADPVLDVSSSHILPGVPVGTYAKYTIAVSNTGSSATSASEPIDVNFTLPAGLKVTAVTDEIKQQFGFPFWDCSIAGDSQSVSCQGPAEEGFLITVPPGEEACELFGLSCRIIVTVRADSDAQPGTVSPTIQACGGGASSCANASDPIDVEPFDFHLTKFDARALDQNGDPATQAGSHPHTATAEFFFPQFLTANGLGFSTDSLKSVITDLPPGLVGNPQGIPTCTEEQLTAGVLPLCPPETQVGEITLWENGGGNVPGSPSVEIPGIYNMKPPAGVPAAFGFNLAGAAVHIYAKVRTGGDYGVTLITKNSPESIALAGITFTVWGVPADPSHDPKRWCAGAFTPGCPSADSADPKPFVSLPTSCIGTDGIPGDPVETFIDVIGWRGGDARSSVLSHDNTLPTPNPIGLDGCNAVDFSPTLETRPTTNVADSPSGLDVDLHIPQNEDPEGTAEAHLKDTTVTLPEGLVINPSGANGLGGCSPAQADLHSEAPARCPDAAEIGTVEVDSPLVDHPIPGAVYLANPYDNPFNSLLALYIAVDDPQTGTVVKLAGQVHADPNTGRLSATFNDNPQLPFEDFKLHFKGGPHGSLRTPATCGTYATTSSLTPWSAPDSGPPATPQDAWAITQSPGGGSCPSSPGARPNSPDLDAGSVSPIAGASTPTVVSLRRADGSQEFSSVNVTLPPGMTGRLVGIPYCSDAALAAAAQHSGRQEEASPSCPAASRIGSVDVAAGAGPDPYHAQGTAHLAGPYKGAPLSMAIVTPATAGPFDLGTVVVRVALYVDPISGQITAISDPIPQILQGIPLDVRSARVHLDRPGFTRNGTSCNPLSFSGQLTSTLGQAAPLAERFQLGECSSLGFKPKLVIRLIGGTTRGAHPALQGTLQMPEGGANIARASVALPHSEFLDQAHIGTVCTRVQFGANECPAASVYGHATATSPLVDYPVEGPVYLRSSSHKLPDLVMALHGPPSQPVEVDAVARIDSIKGGIRSTFEGVPDLPLSKVVLSMEGGKKGLLQNSTNICKGIHKATAEFDAQNGKAADLAPALVNSKCGKARKRQHRSQRRHAVK